LLRDPNETRIRVAVGLSNQHETWRKVQSGSFPRTAPSQLIRPTARAMAEALTIVLND
jgi:hypothetical protein